MIQNAISGLRGVLAADGGTDLLTQAPGYLLRVAPQHLDLGRVEALAQAARTQTGLGRPDDAAQMFQEALRVWRGPVLADLVESGAAWPELAAIRALRPAIQEEYFDLELRRGRHREALSELTDACRAEPHRERLRQLLMLALYRAGRQHDALQLYRLARDATLQDLGLEPGRELRRLEQAILVHDPSLHLPPPEPASEGENPPPGGRPDPHGGAHPAEPGFTGRAAGALPVHPAVAPGTVVERRLVSIVAVALHAEPDQDPEEVERRLREVTLAMREEVEQEGGVRAGSAGPIILAAFGVPSAHDDDAARAVRTALAIRDRLRAPGNPAASGKNCRIAVATGEVLAKYAPDRTGYPDVAGAAVNSSVLIASAAPPGTVWVCDATREASAALISCVEQRTTHPMWQVEALREAPALTSRSSAAAPFVGRESSVDLLCRQLDQAERGARPQLLTVLGETGIGKSRLVLEFLAMVRARNGTRGRPGDVTVSPGPVVLVVRAAGSGHDLAAGILTGLIHLGHDHQLTHPAPAEADITALVHRLAGTGELGQRLTSWLARLPAGPRGRIADLGKAFHALCFLVERIAANRTVVAVFEDLQRADEQSLEFVARLSRSLDPAALFILATARPELFAKYPMWSSTTHNSTVMTLPPLPDAAMAQLLDSSSGNGHRNETRQKSILAKVGGNPLFALEYLAEIGNGRFREGRLPDQVRRVLAARLAKLPPDDKAVLKDAAVLGRCITAAGIAAAGEYGDDRIDYLRRCLDRLEKLQLLNRKSPLGTKDEPAYEFSQVLVREVAYLEMPHPQRAEKHRNARRHGAICRRAFPRRRPPGI
ncbi:AAA family ATPase [Amycolatopsis sp. NBC_00345]|uniref:BTAD domain-containing putative transcriptional regulator n=1 Tax=Amycolatopsis sp. NBC_00345 TaxID=2975955 RepID=UPI002E270E08